MIIWPPACDVETDSNKVITARFDIIKESRSLATLKWNHDFHISLKQILKQERLEFTSRKTNMASLKISLFLFEIHLHSWLTVPLSC